LSSVYLDNFSNSRYDSLQFEARRRFQHGFDFQVNYVFSKWLSDATGLDKHRFEPFLDIHNTKLERARPTTDLTHQFKANYSYEIPLQANRFWNRLIKGWNTSGVLMWQSGNPFTIRSGFGTTIREDFAGGINTANTLLTKTDLESQLQLRMTG